jgi:hypothetical protein
MFTERFASEVDARMDQLTQFPSPFLHLNPAKRQISPRRIAVGIDREAAHVKRESVSR